MWKALLDTRYLISKARRSEIAKYDISSSRAHILFCVQVIGEEATPAKIARYLMVEPQGISKIVNRMVKHGLVEKHDNSGRGRRVRISLTSTGQRAVKNMAEVDGVRQKVNSIFREEELRKIKRYLKEVRNFMLKYLNEKADSLPFESGTEVWRLIVQVNRLMLKGRKPILAKCRVPDTQFETLCTIHEIGERATPTEVSRRTYRKLNTITGIINRMEKAGLVKKIKNHNKSNSVRLIITEKGLDIYNKAEASGISGYLLSCLSQEAKHQLLGYLERIQGYMWIWFKRNIDNDSKPFAAP